MKLLNIISVSYGHRYQLKAFIACLVGQTSHNWQAVLINDGQEPDCEAMVEADLTFYKQSRPDLPIVYKETETRYNDFGHSLRDMELQLTETKYLMWQNSDNFLMPRLVEICLEKMERENLDLLLFNMVHNYPNISGRGEPPYSVLNSSPWLNACDIGSFMIKTELAKRVGFTDRVSYADGLFINRTMTTNPKWGKCDSILAVHN